MQETREERMRARAHELWEQDGRPEGKETEHWYRAAREIEAADTENPAADERTTPDILKTTTALR